MNISRIAAFLIPFLLGSACSASAASVKASRAAEPKRPNIILFLVDDMGWPCPFGGKRTALPNLLS